MYDLVDELGARRGTGRAHRVLTVVAIGFLLLDGALLLLAGFWSGRPGLMLFGAAFVGTAGAVYGYWLRYQRHLRELAVDLEIRRQELLRLKESLLNGTDRPEWPDGE